MKSSCVLAACILGAAADHRVYYSDGDASSFGSVLVNTTVPPKNVSRTHKYNLLDLAYKTADWVCGGYDNVNVWNLGNTKDSNGGFWDNGRTECDKGSNSWHGTGVKCMERFMEVEKVEYSEYVIEQQMAPVHLQVLVNGSNGAQSGSHQWSESEANAYEWNWSETLEIEMLLNHIVRILNLLHFHESLHAFNTASVPTIRPFVALRPPVVPEAAVGVFRIA